MPRGREPALVSEAQGAARDDQVTSILDTPQAWSLVIRGMALRAGGYAVGVLLAMVSGAVALRYLGVIDAGRLITVLALTTIVGGLSDLGLSSIAVREYSTLGTSQREEAMRHILGLRLSLTIVGVIAATLFAVLADYPRVMVVGTLISGTALFLVAVHQTLTVPLSTGLRLGWVTALTLFAQLGIAIGFVGLSIVGAGLTTFYAVQVLALIPVVVLAFLLVRGTISIRPAWKPQAWRRRMRDILPYSVAVVLYILYFRFALIAVSLLSSEEETGYYAASFRILDVLTLVPALLAASAFPLLARAAHDDRERLYHAIGRLSQGMLILGAWIGVAIGLAAPLAIEIVAGPEFEPAVEPLRIQAVALLGASLLAVWGYGLLSLARHRAIMLANAVSVALAATLSIALVPRYGAVGAAITLTVAELGLAAGYGAALARSYPGLLRRLGAAPRILAAAGLALAVPLLLGLEGVLAVLVGTALYTLALLAFRAIPVGLRSALLGHIGRPG